jgi:hypothetical protein
MTRIAKIRDLRQRIAALPKLSRKRPPLERELSRLIVHQIAAEHRRDRRQQREAA